MRSSPRCWSGARTRGPLSCLMPSRPAAESRPTSSLEHWTVAGAGGALVATFGVFFLAGLRVTTRAREVKVPDLHGKSVDRGARRARRAGARAPHGRDRGARQDRAGRSRARPRIRPGDRRRRQRAVRVVSDGQPRCRCCPRCRICRSARPRSTLAVDRVPIGYRAEVRTDGLRPGVVIGAGSRRPPSARPASICS